MADPVSSAQREDWASTVTAKVEEIVSVVRDRTVRPVQQVVRVAIFALVATTAVAVVAVMTAIGLVRILDNLAFRGHVWASYLVIGGIFVLAGLLISSRGTRRS